MSDVQSSIPDKVYVSALLEEDEVGAPGEAIRLRREKTGRSEVETGKLIDRFKEYLKVARAMVGTAEEQAEGWHIDSITLHFGVDAEVGLVFVAKAGIEAAIDLELKRK